MSGPIAIRKEPRLVREPRHFEPEDFRKSRVVHCTTKKAPHTFTDKPYTVARIIDTRWFTLEGAKVLKLLTSWVGYPTGDTFEPLESFVGERDNLAVREWLAPHPDKSELDDHCQRLQREVCEHLHTLRCVFMYHKLWALKLCLRASLFLCLEFTCLEFTCQ